MKDDTMAKVVFLCVYNTTLWGVTAYLITSNSPWWGLLFLGTMWPKNKED